MTIYTQADADAAKAKLALDTQTLADDQQAALAAQAGVTSAAQAVADAQAQADAAAAAVVVAQQNAAVAQAALSSANDAVAAVQADMVAQQAIIDAYAAQPPVVIPPAPPTTVGGMPDLPVFPVGPFAKHSSMTISSSAAINLNGVEFGGSYICINHKTSSISLAGVNLDNVTADAEAGSLFYCGSMCGGKGATIGKVGCNKVRHGRPFLRFCGVWGPITISDLTAIYDPSPNTMTGDIATGIQLGNKATGEALESCVINRAHVENIYCNWPTTEYWNGDGLTTERTLKYFQVDNFTGKNITDGGIDSKARKNVFGRVYVENMRAALKVWDDTDCAHLTSINPTVQGGIGGCSHLRLMGSKDGRVRLFNFPDVTAKGSATLFRVENGPVKIVASGTYDGSDLLFATNGGSVTPDSTWNGKPIK